jgi:hypothetical protein
MEQLIRDCWDGDIRKRPMFEEIVDRIIRERIVVGTCDPDSEEYQGYCKLIGIASMNDDEED